MEKNSGELSIETLLQHTRSLLLIYRGKPLHPHELQERYCPHCGVESFWITQRCNNRFCRQCRAREYQTLRRKQQSIDVPPSRFIHLVFPMAPILLQRIRPADIDSLKNAVGKIRRQKWFKQVVLGGFYALEMDVNKRLEVRPHVHMLVETVVSARRNPIDIEKANRSWVKSMGHTIQGPFPLRRFTIEDVNRRFVYLIKQLQGEQSIKGVKELHTYIARQSDRLESDTDLRDEYETRKLKRIIQRAERLRAYIVHVLNYVLVKQRRYAFFGTWRDVKPVQQAKRFWRCPCGSYTRPVSHTVA